MTAARNIDTVRAAIARGRHDSQLLDGRDFDPALWDGYEAALEAVEARLAAAEEALRDARAILIPAGHSGKERDAWRLDRARWLHQQGDTETAAAELKDMNDLRDLYRHEGRPGNDEIPQSALDEPVGSDVLPALDAAKEGTA